MRAQRGVIRCLLGLGLIAALPMMVLAQGNEEGAVKAELSLRVDSSSLDLGEVTAGQDAVAVFTIHNDSDTPVKILKAKPS